MRREARVEIQGADNRDAGKKFLITEMGAVQAESWGMRAMGLAMRSGLELNADTVNGGLPMLAIAGVNALMRAPYADSKPLLDEMMGCVQIIEPLITRPLLDSDIEEISTIVRLREEVATLHLGFSLAGALLAAGQIMQAAAEVSSNIPTSASASDASSPPSSPVSPSSKPSTARRTSTTSSKS